MFWRYNSTSVLWGSSSELLLAGRGGGRTPSSLARGVVEESGVALGHALGLDVDVVVRRGVEMADGHARDLLHGELLPDRRELLAVAAPGGVELDEGGLFAVRHQLLEVLPHNLLDHPLIR